MTADKQKMADKIRALLAKAASTTNETEAEVFLAKAKELMEKHQLDAKDLEHDDPVGHERTYASKRLDWDFHLLFPVATYYGCKAIRIVKHRGQEMDLVGRESARVTAIEMHKYLVKTVRKLGREKASTMGIWDESWQDPEYDEPISYMNPDQASRAIGHALNERLRILAYKMQRQDKAAVTPSGKNALITLDSVAALFKKLHPDAESFGGSRVTNDAARGIAAGIGLNLQTGGANHLQLK